MSIPDYSALAKQIFDSRPEDVTTLRAICDATDALRASAGADDPGVQDGERRANDLKGMFTRRIAYACYRQDARFGLRLKATGAHAVRPVDGLPLATDVLLWQDGQVIDVMSDRNVSWGIKDGDMQPVKEWVQPLPEVGDVSIPSTDPPAPVENPPVPVQVDLSPVLAALAQLHADHIALGHEVDTLKDQIEELTAKPDPAVTVPPVTFPVYSGSIFGMRVKLTPEAK